MEERKRSQPGALCQGPVSTPAAAPSLLHTQTPPSGWELEPELEQLPLPSIQCQGWPGSASGDSSGPGVLAFLTLFSDL